METFEAIRTVLAVRSYADRSIPAETARRIVEAGRLTASSQNHQPWHFLVIRDREVIGRLAGAVSRNGPYIAEAPLVVAVAADRVPSGVSDASRAIQSMVLAAWSEGIGSNWVGGVSSLGEAKAVLGVPDDVDLVALLPFGYPATEVGKGQKKRKGWDEVVMGDRWGAPFTGE